MASYYLIFKVAHLFFVISWMVGVLYLPRIYVYHADTAINSEADLIFRKMERRLMNIIMNPAMIMSYVFGFLLAYIYGLSALGLWFYIKIFAVFVITLMHMLFFKYMKDFARGANMHSAKFYRLINEIPSVSMIIVIIMIVVKPFE